MDNKPMSDMEYLLLKNFIASDNSKDILFFRIVFVICLYLSIICIIAAIVVSQNNTHDSNTSLYLLIASVILYYCYRATKRYWNELTETLKAEIAALDEVREIRSKNQFASLSEYDATAHYFESSGDSENDEDSEENEITN